MGIETAIAAAGVGASLLDSGGGSGSGTQTVVNEPWSGLKPYLTGESEYRPQTQRPLNSDWLYWNYMAGQGMPIGPPPPMYVDDPQYSGQNVYDPPFQFQNARLTGPAYGDSGPYGASVPDTGGLLGNLPNYPSGGDGGLLRPPTAPSTPEPAPEQPSNNSGAADALWAQFVSESQRGDFANQANQGQNLDSMMMPAHWLNNRNQDANAILAAWREAGYI